MRGLRLVLLLAMSILTVPHVCQANIGWVGMFVVAYPFFAIASIIASLAVEWPFVKAVTGTAWGKAFWMTLSMNVYSAIAGLFIVPALLVVIFGVNELWLALGGPVLFRGGQWEAVQGLLIWLLSPFINTEIETRVLASRFSQDVRNSRGRKYIGAANVLSAFALLLVLLSAAWL